MLFRSKTDWLKNGKKRIHGTSIPDRNAVDIDIWLGIQVNGVHNPDHQQWCSTGTSAFYSLDAGLSGKQLAKRDGITSPGQFLLYKLQGVARGFFGLLANLARPRPILRHETDFQVAASGNATSRSYDQFQIFFHVVILSVWGLVLSFPSN